MSKHSSGQYMVSSYLDKQTHDRMVRISKRVVTMGGHTFKPSISEQIKQALLFGRSINEWEFHSQRKES